MAISLTDKVRQKRNIVFKKLGTEIHILNPEFGTICSLNDSGAMLWEGMEKPITITKLVSQLVTHYGIPDTTARKDTLKIIQKMLQAHIIEKVK